MDANPNWKLVAGALLAVFMIPAYIYMKAHQIDHGDLFAVLTPLVVFLIIGAKVDEQSEHQNKKLDTIQRQTNGMLDKMWAQGYRQSALDLAAKGLVSPDVARAVEPPTRPAESATSEPAAEDEQSPQTD